MARTHLQPFCFKAEILAGNEGGLISMSRCGQACPLNVHYYLATEKTRKPQEDWVVFLGEEIQSFFPFGFGIFLQFIHGIQSYTHVTYICNMHMYIDRYIYIWYVQINVYRHTYCTCTIHCIPANLPNLGARLVHGQHFFALGHWWTLCWTRRSILLQSQLSVV